MFWLFRSRTDENKKDTRQAKEVLSKIMDGVKKKLRKTEQSDCIYLFQVIHQLGGLEKAIKTVLLSTAEKLQLRIHMARGF